MMEYLDYFFGAAFAAAIFGYLEYRQTKREKYWKEERKKIADQHQREVNQWLANQKYIQIGNIIYRQATQDESCDQIINGIRWRACDIAK